MKKLWASICLLLIVSTSILLSGCFGYLSSLTSEEMQDTSDTSKPEDVVVDDTNHQLLVNIEFTENLLFSRYDVDLYIDDSFVATLSHGVSMCSYYELSNGNHQVKFCKSSDNSINSSKSISVDGDMYFYCNISTSMGGISIDKLICEKNTPERLAIIESISGTYIGENGSGLTLCKDGSAEYYYKDWSDVETNLIWKYDNGKITWTSSNMGCTVSAQAGESLEELLFVSDSIMWDDEKYVKYNEDSEKKSAAEYKELIFQKEYQEEAKKVDEAIDKIGTVDENSKKAISEARKLYDACSEGAKKYITNYSVLQDAEETLSQIEKEMKEQKLQKEIFEIEKKINDVGTVTLEKEEQIQNIRKQISKLAPESIDRISNYSLFVENEKALEELQIENVESLISVFEGKTITLDDKYAVTAARNAFGRLPDGLKDRVKNKDILDNAKSALDKLEQEEKNKNVVKTRSGEVLLAPKDSTLHKDFDSKNNSIVIYVNVDNLDNKPKLVDWNGITVTNSVAEYLEYLTDSGCLVSVSNNSLREPYDGFYLYEVSFSVTSNSVTWTMDLTIQDELYVEYELDIYLPA